MDFVISQETALLRNSNLVIRLVGVRSGQSVGVRFNGSDGSIANNEPSTWSACDPYFWSAVVSG